MEPTTTRKRKLDRCMKLVALLVLCACLTVVPGLLMFSGVRQSSFCGVDSVRNDSQQSSVAIQHFVRNILNIYQNSTTLL